MGISKRNQSDRYYVFLLESLETRALLSAAFDITGLTALRANSAFSQITGQGVGIAVLDTGVDAANPDLTANVKAFYNAVENPVSSTNVSPSNAVDNDGHGSHVSGIAASSNPSIGVASDASLVDIKVIADSGESQLGGDPVLRGLQWVAANYQTYNIKVVNMSLGQAGVNDNTVTASDAAAAEALEIKALQQLGITVVSASGNSYANSPTPGESFPAIVSTIGVANTWATTGQASDFGVPYGESGDQFYAVDNSATVDTLASTSQRSTVSNQLAAPGEDIYSTWNGTLDSSNGNDVLHNTISGTSMATPFVSGVVALMQQAAKYFGGHYISDPAEILQILTQTADTIVDSNNPNNARYNSGNGATSNLPETGLSFKRVDVLKAIEEVRNLVTGGTITDGPAPGPDTDNTTTTATPVNAIDGTTVFTFGGSIGTDGLVQVASDVDLFKLDVVSPGQMTFALTQPTSGTAFAASLRLFDSSGNIVASTVGTSSAYPTLTTNGALAVGTYYLGISSAGNQSYTINGTGAANGGAGGDYSLQITLMNPDPNGTIQGSVTADLTSPNQILTDPNTGANYTAVVEQGELGSDPPATGSTTRITVSSDVDMFKVTAPDNGTLTLTTESDPFSGDTTFLEVFDSNGNPLKNSSGISSENILTLNNLTSGLTYFVAVTIPGNSGFNPSDPYLGRVANGTPSDQSYTLYLRFDNGDVNGTALNAITETMGTPITGNIGSDNGVTIGANGSKDVDWFNYTANNDGLFNIVAQSSTPGLTPVITLWTYDSGNNIVKIADSSSSSLFASSASAFAPAALTTTLGLAQLTYEVGFGQSYFVAITGQGNSNFNWYAQASGTGGATGGYVLTTQLESLTSLQALNDNSITNGTPQTITAGQTIQSNLGADGSLVVGANDIDLYKYVATANGPVDIRTFTNQEGDADTVLRVFSSTGSQLGSNDNIDATTTASEVKLTLVKGQTYYIGVSGAGPGALSYNPLTGANAGDGSTGNYSLSVTPIAPGFSVSSPTPISASTGGVVVFTITLDQPLSAAATVNYTTTDGTAIAGADYTAVSGTLTFAAGTTSHTVSVPIIANRSSATGARTFSLTLSNASGAMIGSATGTATINEGSTVVLPAVSISTPAPIPAYTGGVLVFNVSLDQASATSVTVDYATVNGTAVAGTDYTATSGTLTFAAGVVTQTVTVPVLANITAPQGNVTFTLDLSNPTGATLSMAAATGTIQDLPVTTLTFSSSKSAKYTDSAGKAVQLILNGPGKGTAIFVNGALDPAQVTLAHTTDASTFAIHTTSATLADIVVSGSLRSLNAPSANLTGGLTVSGSLGSLALENVGGSTGGAISIGGAATLSLVKLGVVTNESLSTAGAITLLKVSEWVNTGAAPSILSATRIDSLTSNGDFAASISANQLGTVKIGGSMMGGTWSIANGAGKIAVAGDVAAAWAATFGGDLKDVRFGSDAGSLTADAINRISIGGDMSAATITLTGSGNTLMSLSVGQTVSNSQIRSAGNIGKVAVGAFLDSNLFAGVSPSITTLPTSTADFVSNDSIVSFSVTGKATRFSFSNSNIAAESIGKVLLARVDSNNAGTPFGVATGNLDAFTNRGVLKWTKKQPPSALVPDGDLVVNLLT